MTSIRTDAHHVINQTNIQTEPYQRRDANNMSIPHSHAALPGAPPGVTTVPVVVHALSKELQAFFSHVERAMGGDAAPLSAPQVQLDAQLGKHFRHD
jgi:hypothetical protein